MKRTALPLFLFATFVSSVAGLPLFGQETEERELSRERLQEQRSDLERSREDLGLQSNHPQQERLPQRGRPPARPLKQPRLRGYFAVSPLRDATPETLRAAVAAAATTTIPLFNYTFVGYDGNTYPGTMVGRSPFAHGARTTNVHLILVPLIIKMPDGGTFDPTAADACASGKTDLSLVQGSPLLTPTDFIMNGVDVGTAQYVDAFQRANFWTNVSATGSRYHTILSPVTVLSAVTVTVPAGSGQTWAAANFGGCGNLGVIDANYWDPSLNGGTSRGEAGTLLTSLASQGIGPTILPIFLLPNVVFASSGTSPTVNCCILGYHGSIGPVATLQTYSPLDFDSTGLFSPGNISIMSHEVGEWMDDPTGINAVPVWGGIGQQAGCQNNLEVGDPLSAPPTNPFSVTQNGFTYAMQELAFFSWFFGGTSLGSGGKYSNNGTFTGFAIACPPGGTH